MYDLVSNDGQTQLDESVELSMSKKPQLLSDPRTQITTTPVETGELVIEAHIHSYTYTCTHVHYTHKTTIIFLAKLLL